MKGPNFIESEWLFLRAKCGATDGAEIEKGERDMMCLNT